MIVSGLASRHVGLVTAALDLSFWSWAFGPASFLTLNRNVSAPACWDIRLVTPAFGLALFLSSNYDCFWTCMLAHWTCHSSIGLVILISIKYQLVIVSGFACWDIAFVTAALDLSFWSWAFGPASFLISNWHCFWTCMLRHWTWHRSIGLVILKLGLRPSSSLHIKLQ